MCHSYPGINLLRTFCVILFIFFDTTVEFREGTLAIAKLSVIFPEPLKKNESNFKQIFKFDVNLNAYALPFKIVSALKVDFVPLNTSSVCELSVLFNAFDEKLNKFKIFHKKK